MIVNENVVVTGGAGFIGSHLVDELLDGGAARVIVVDDFFLGKPENLEAAQRRFGPALRIYRDSAADPAVMSMVVEEHKPSIVFNLATRPLLYSYVNPPGSFRINVDFAQVLGELLRAGAYAKLIQVSSSEVYGSAQYAPMDEAHPLVGHTSYAAGKAAADLLLQSYARMFDLDVTIVRPFNNYGPRQNERSMAAIVPLTVCRIRDGHVPVIEGDGEQTRDFAFVRDTVRAMIKLSIRKDVRGLTLNLGAGRETTITNLVNAICAVMGYSGPIERLPARPSDVRRHHADVRAAERLIGPISETPLEDGLASTVSWFRSS